MRYDLLKTDLLKLLFLTLPAFAGILLVQIKGSSFADVFIFLIYIGYMLPTITISGILISWLVRDKPNAKKLSMLGYAVPSLIASWYFLSVIFLSP